MDSKISSNNDSPTSTGTSSRFKSFNVEDILKEDSRSTITTSSSSLRKRDEVLSPFSTNRDGVRTTNSSHFTTNSSCVNSTDASHIFSNAYHNHLFHRQLFPSSSLIGGERVMPSSSMFDRSHLLNLHHNHYQQLLRLQQQAQDHHRSSLLHQNSHHHVSSSLPTFFSGPSSSSSSTTALPATTQGVDNLLPSSNAFGSHQSVAISATTHSLLTHLNPLAAASSSRNSSIEPKEFSSSINHSSTTNSSPSPHHTILTPPPKPTDLNVVYTAGSTFNSNQVHPIFAVSPSSGITYSWVSPPKSLPRKRTVFTRRQRHELESKFQAQKYISKSERIRFARELGLKDSQVKVWFINRRTKWRNDTEKRKLRANKSSSSTTSSGSSSSEISVVTVSNSDRLNHSSSRLL